MSLASHRIPTTTLPFGPFSLPDDISADQALLRGLLNSRLRGEAYSPTPAQLPQDATLEVRLMDISIGDGPAIMLSKNSIVPARQIPIGFDIPYDSHQIQRGRTYSISGTIRAGGKLLYANDCTQLVFTDSNPAYVNLRLAPIG